MSQTKSVKRIRTTFTCASGHTALSDECGWTFSWIILLWFGRTPTLGGKGCQRQISWDALADILRVPVHQCILPFFKSWAQYPGEALSFLLDHDCCIASNFLSIVLEIYRHTFPPEQQTTHWSALLYSLLQTGGFSCGSNLGFYVWRSFHFRSGDDRWPSWNRRVYNNSIPLENGAMEMEEIYKSQAERTRMQGMLSETIKSDVRVLKHWVIGNLRHPCWLWLKV